MDKPDTANFRKALMALARRGQETAAGLEEAARSSTGGEAAGGISNAPMHLADIGSEVYTQELNATLLENEDYLMGEVRDALGRVQAGTFGTCEACRKAIPIARLEALPYARYCVPCAEKAEAKSESGHINLNTGRPAGWGSTFEHPNSLAKNQATEHSPTVASRADAPGYDDEDVHAAGSPGGGSAVGGLAGTNIGGGDPNDAPLEDAMGSANFDPADEGDEPEAGDSYGGASGGAVGGTPANKRAKGGRPRA